MNQNVEGAGEHNYFRRSSPPIEAGLVRRPEALWPRDPEETGSSVRRTTSVRPEDGDGRQTCESGRRGGLRIRAKPTGRSKEDL